MQSGEGFSREGGELEREEDNLDITTTINQRYQQSKYFNLATLVAQEMSEGEAGDQSSAFREIASAMAQAGEFSQAKKVVDRISNQEERVYALKDIADIMIDSEVSNLNEEAKEILNRALSAIDTDDPRTDFPEMIKAQVIGSIEKAGDNKKAEELANSHLAWGEIALAQAKKGEYDKAHSTVNNISEQSTRESTFYNIAKLPAESGNYDQALNEVEENISSKNYTSTALTEIALKMSDEDNSVKQEKLQKVLERTKESIDSNADDKTRNRLLIKIIKPLASCGKYDEASTLIEKSLSSKYKPLAKRRLMVEKAKNEGDFTECKAQAKKKEGEARAKFLKSISVAMGESGNLEDAEETAKEIQHPLRSEALREVAVIYAKAGDLEKAQSVAEDIDASKEEKAIALANVASEADNETTLNSDSSLRSSEVIENEYTDKIEDMVKEGLNNTESLISIGGGINSDVREKLLEGLTFSDGNAERLEALLEIGYIETHSSFMDEPELNQFLENYRQGKYDLDEVSTERKRRLEKLLGN
ncbi:MAG: tetratricopeptide repeat protein [Candidatus Paceibacteria bacterium]